MKLLKCLFAFLILDAAVSEVGGHANSMAMVARTCNILQQLYITRCAMAEIR